MALGAISKGNSMKNFGKMTVAKEDITDEETGVIVNVSIYRDANGEDWLDVAAANPHPFYIAVNDDNMVVCISDDASMIQLDGLTMYGVDENFGYTGREALGKFWNGSAIVEPPVSFPNLTARQLRLGLLSFGKLDAVPTAIAALPEPEKSQADIEWQFASEFKRDHPLILQLIPILGLTDEQVDAVWIEFSTV